MAKLSGPLSFLNIYLVVWAVYRLSKLYPSSSLTKPIITLAIIDDDLDLPSPVFSVLCFRFIRAGDDPCDDELQMSKTDCKMTAILDDRQLKKTIVAKSVVSDKIYSRNLWLSNIIFNYI